MASLNMFLAPATISTTVSSSTSSITTTTSSIATTRARRVQTFATAAKGSGGSTEEKGFFDFLMGALVKFDQLVETDPILQKVEGKSGTTTISSKKTTTSAAPPKKDAGSGGFGGLGGFFAKK